MNKKTVIAMMRAEIATSDSFREYLEHYSEAWFSRDGGDLFLHEFGHERNSAFIEHLQQFFGAHFRQAGLSENLLPTVELTDSRRGSWIMEAALTMFGTVGTTYAVLKGVAELSEIADGIEKTKKRLHTELQQIFRKKISERIEPTIGNSHDSRSQAVSPPNRKRATPPTAPVDVSFSIDARPLRGLTPDKVKSHSIHLSVGISRSALSVENLGDAQLETLRIGLFKSQREPHSWNFGDAYSKTVPTLGPRQSISFSVSEFCSQGGTDKLSLDADYPLFVDCWLQDNNGIYLFNFYLE